MCRPRSPPFQTAVPQHLHVWQRKVGGVTRDYARLVTVAAGERFIVLEDHETYGLTSWFAPFTGDFDCKLPAGLVLVCEGRQVEGAPGFACRPEEYKAVEPLLVPKRDREDPKYGGYWFVLMESEIGTWFDSLDRSLSLNEDPGTCVCSEKEVTKDDWCWACGHTLAECPPSCRRGRHGWCRPERNTEERARRDPGPWLTTAVLAAG